MKSSEWINLALRISRLVLLAVLGSFSVSQAHGAGTPMSWDASAVARSPSFSTRLLGPDKQTVATISVQRVKTIVEVKQKIERQAGVVAQLFLQDGNEPNAASGANSSGNFIVAINLAMIDLIGDDSDAYATVLGHEFAHLTLGHSKIRREREQVRSGLSQLLGTALGLAGIPFGGTIASLGTTVVSRVYSRDEERDADNTGLKYAADAGFDPAAGPKLWEKMAAKGNIAIPFLATHPAATERVDNMKQLALSLSKQRPTLSAANVAPDTKPSVVTFQPTVTDGSPQNTEAMRSRYIYGVMFIQKERSVVIDTIFRSSHSAPITINQGDILINCEPPSVRITTLSDIDQCKDSAGEYWFLVERRGLVQRGKLKPTSDSEAIILAERGERSGPVESSTSTPKIEKSVAVINKGLATEQTNATPTVSQGRLPPCLGSYNNASWTNCVGEISTGNSAKYIGAFRDGNRHGRGIEYAADGSVLQSGIWDSGTFVHWSKVDVSPTIDQARPQQTKPSTVPVPAESSANDRAFWDSVKDTKNPAELKAYLDQFPTGIFAALAKLRLKAMQAEKEPTVATSIATPQVAGDDLWVFLGKDAVGDHYLSKSSIRFEGPYALFQVRAQFPDRSSQLDSIAANCSTGSISIREYKRLSPTNAIIAGGPMSSASTIVVAPSTPQGLGLSIACGLAGK